MPSRIDWYQRNLRQAVRGLWSGLLTYDQALEALLSTIARGLTQAFYQGAAECGINPDELTDVENNALQGFIIEEQSYAAGILDFADKEISLAELYSRLNRWTTRYLDIQNQGKLYACKDEKLIWELGRVEKHCPSCKKVAGRVKRASFWQRVGVYPQQPPNPNLECKGFYCQCRLTPTSLPITPGPLPFLP